MRFGEIRTIPAAVVGYQTEACSGGARDVALSLIGLANLAARRGDLTKQEDYLHQALSLDEKLNPADRATIFQGLGAACLQRGQPDKAEEYFTQTLVIRQELLPDSLALAISLSEIGSLASNRGDPDQAEKYFRQALEIRERLATGSLAFAASLSNVGSIVQVRGDLATGREVFPSSADDQAATCSRKPKPKYGRKLTPVRGCFFGCAVIWQRRTGISIKPPK